MFGIFIIMLINILVFNLKRVIDFLRKLGFKKNLLDFI